MFSARVKKTVGIILLCFYFCLNIHQWTWYSNGKIHPCKTPNREMKDLKSLIRDTHLSLKELGLTHVLTYGSLWGAMRYNDPLPWDNDVDMALIDQEVNKIDQKTIIQTFAKRNIDIYYRVWFGTYRVNRATARGDLMVFRKTFFNEMARTGIEPWLFFINYRRFHTFPAYLIEKPLPSSKFAGVNISVPRNGVEIQKHFYPRDWWRESKPTGC